jgi:hypothetical protein
MASICKLALAKNKRKASTGFTRTQELKLFPAWETVCQFNLEKKDLLSNALTITKVKNEALTNAEPPRGNVRLKNVFLKILG